MESDEVEALARDLGTFASGSMYGAGPSSKREEFSSLITREHRTIQQNIGRVVIQLLEAWSEQFNDGVFDARNEAICKFAADAIRSTEPNDRILPYI